MREVVGGEIIYVFFFFQAEDGIRDFCLSRGLGDVYKRQSIYLAFFSLQTDFITSFASSVWSYTSTCLLYTSDAADEEDSVDLGGRRIIKKKKKRRGGRWADRNRKDVESLRMKGQGVRQT
ncbi:hypothetical protein CDFC105_93918 [Clostridioides difficile]|nr:hypothetical protein CDFC105_93918 [Clostridioides difficile]